jgi:hypothetical protein
MLEKHYVHVTPTTDARLLAGLPDPQFALVHDFILRHREQQEKSGLHLSAERETSLTVDSSGGLSVA